MVHTLPADYEKTVVYPAYRKLLDAASQGRNWTWCEVCPDAIVRLSVCSIYHAEAEVISILTLMKIGFTPNGSQFSLSLHWAQYLSLYAYNHKNRVEGTPVEVPYPGNTASANSLFTPVSSKTIARFMIYASLRPGVCGNGQLFNIADSKVPCTYGALWPRLAAWFGLVGVSPAADGDGGGDSQTKDTLKVGEVRGTSSMTPGEYIDKYKDVFAQNRRANAVSGGVGVGHRQLDSVGYWLTFDRQMSLDRLEGTGFDCKGDVVQGWLETLEMFRRAGLIL